MRDPLRPSSNIVRASLVWIGGLLGAVFLSGCQPTPEEPRLSNAARYTVLTSPPVEYVLDEISIQRGQGTTVKWSKGDLFVETNSALDPGTSSSPTYIYTLPGIFHGDTIPGSDWCGSECEGASTVSVDSERSERVVDLKIKFKGGLPICTTRYRVTFGPDTSATYQECADESRCLSRSDCCCQPIVPCSGAVARNPEEFCLNLDYVYFQADTLVEANAHVRQ